MKKKVKVIDRNCDRFAEVYEARQAFYLEYAGILPDRDADLERAFAEWLFDPAPYEK